MQLPHSAARQKYIEHIQTVETNLKDAASGEKDKALLALVQKRLDALAEKYQYDEQIGAARYKLYELQALVHYFNDDDDAALDFIDQAIETRGESYPKAEKLKAQLRRPAQDAVENIDPKSMSKQERRKLLIGVEGWLAFFVVGVGLSILLGVINLLGYGSAFNDLASARFEAPDYVAAMTPLLMFEVLINLTSLSIAIWLIVLIAKHKKLARTVAIIYLAAGVGLMIVDYIWAVAVFDAFDVTTYVQTALNRAAADIGRGLLGVAIWVPYFRISKRVKATLTR